MFDRFSRSVFSKSKIDRTVCSRSIFWRTVFGRAMEVHEEQGNLQEWWIGTVESIGRECLWRNGVFIPLRFLFNLTLIFQDSLEDITVLVKRTSISGRKETRGFGKPLFHHGAMCSKLCTRSTRKRMTDGP